MNYLQFKQSLDKNLLTPLYLIHGEETYLADKALNLLKSKVIGGKEPDMSLISFSGEENSAREIIAASDSMSLFGGQKLIVVKNTQAMKAKGHEILAKYFQKSNLSNILVFIVEGKTDQRKLFFKSLKKYGQVVDCAHPSYRDCLNWLKRQAKACGYELAPKAAEHLLEVGGRNLRFLDNELNKVITFAGEQKSIRLEDIEAVMGRRPSYPVFQLTDALRQKQLKKVLRILNQLLNENNHPLLILSMIANQLRKIAQAKELLSKGLPAAQIGQRIGILPFLRKDFVEQADNYTLKQLKHALGSLLETDIKLKSSAQTPHILLEALFIDLCAE